MRALKISTTTAWSDPVYRLDHVDILFAYENLCADAVGDARVARPDHVGACGGNNNHHPPDAPPPDAPAPLTILAAGASEGAITDEAAEFTTKTGLSYTFTIQSATALQTSITGGSIQPDVVVVTPAVITAINDFVLADSNVNLGQIGGGLAVRAGDPLPAINTVAAFTDTLTQADVWYYSTGTAGKAFEKIVMTLNLTDQLAGKQNVLAGGKDAMLALAADTTHLHPIAVSQLSEIMSVPTVQYVGPYPGNLQTTTVYSAIILKSSTRVRTRRSSCSSSWEPSFRHGWLHRDSPSTPPRSRSNGRLTRNHDRRAQRQVSGKGLVPVTTGPTSPAALFFGIARRLRSPAGRTPASSRSDLDACWPVFIEITARRDIAMHDDWKPERPTHERAAFCPIATSSARSSRLGDTGDWRWRTSGIVAVGRGSAGASAAAAAAAALVAAARRRCDAHARQR